MKFATKLAASLGMAALGVGLFAPTATAAPNAPHALVSPESVELGAKILGEMDRRASAFEDAQYMATMSVYRDGHLKNTLVFDMMLKGVTKQLMSFTAPGDVAGMKVLLTEDKLYTYLPEFKKVRQVAVHVESQGFLDSTFTMGDQKMILLSPLYDAEFVGKDGSLTTLKLTAKPDKSLAHPVLEVVIDGTKGGVTLIRYFDGAGTLVRKQERDHWIAIDGVQMPTQVTMTDEKSGDSSVIHLSNIVVNQGLADDLFSRRMLLRG